jgi:dTDP-D-glucose 4,6-dehydratase
MFEDQVLEPTNPYAATKAGAEFIAKSYSRSEILVYALIPSPCHGI